MTRTLQRRYTDVRRTTECYILVEWGHWQDVGRTLQGHYCQIWRQIHFENVQEPTFLEINTNPTPRNTQGFELGVIGYMGGGDWGIGKGYWDIAGGIKREGLNYASMIANLTRSSKSFFLAAMAMSRSGRIWRVYTPRSSRHPCLSCLPTRTSLKRAS